MARLPWQLGNTCRDSLTHLTNPAEMVSLMTSLTALFRWSRHKSGGTTKTCKSTSCNEAKKSYILTRNDIHPDTPYPCRPDNQVEYLIVKSPQLVRLGTADQVLHDLLSTPRPYILRRFRLSSPSHNATDHKRVVTLGHRSALHKQDPLVHQSMTRDWLWLRMLWVAISTSASYPFSCSLSSALTPLLLT